MAKSPESPAAAPEPDAESAKKKKEARQPETVRDTIESILFAFILAFLYRTFEQEAFVIPTGSMAPTLFGRHKEADCEGCGYHLIVGASQEFNADYAVVGRNERITAAICPNCGFLNTNMKEALAFNGDRILVNKFAYEFGDPSRWDVFVFKFPEQPKTNYIKRLVGLSGETIRIRGGDLFLVEGNSETMLRKPPDKQRGLQIPVYDDANSPQPLIAAGWPERWAGMSLDAQDMIWQDAAGGWNSDRAARTYSLAAPSGAPLRWLRYRHYLPMPDDWKQLANGLAPEPSPRLIGDLCGYNLTLPSRDRLDEGPFWDGDLTVNCRVEIQKVEDQAELLLEICEGTYWYRCRIDPRSGAAKLESVHALVNLAPKEVATAETSIRGPGTYNLSFTNVDNRLCLWVNNRLVEFGEAAILPEPGATGNPYPTNIDLTPVGIAATGMELQVSRLLLERDVYYRVAHPPNNTGDLGSLTQALHDPAKWAAVYARHNQQFGQRDLIIPEGHYLAFGDNSPESNDSRMWTKDPPTVPANYLVGRAFFIYWPHGVPFLNGGRGFTITRHVSVDSVDDRPELVGGKRREKMLDYPRYTAPFYPQFTRMHRIR